VIAGAATRQQRARTTHANCLQHARNAGGLQTLDRSEAFMPGRGAALCTPG
jgi:hypothetical protein